MKCTGSISVPIPPDDAIALFTPEGERAWVPNWDPQHHSDSVFTTAHAIWVVLDSEPRAVRYARVPQASTQGPSRSAATPTARPPAPRSPTTSRR
jgi:hypothetical protein